MPDNMPVNFLCQSPSQFESHWTGVTYKWGLAVVGMLTETWEIWNAYNQTNSLYVRTIWSKFVWWNGGWGRHLSLVCRRSVVEEYNWTICLRTFCWSLSCNLGTTRTGIWWEHNYRQFSQTQESKRTIMHNSVDLESPWEKDRKMCDFHTSQIKRVVLLNVL